MTRFFCIHLFVCFISHIFFRLLQSTDLLTSWMISYINVQFLSKSEYKILRLLGSRIEKCGCPIVITSYVRPSVCPSTLSLCCENSNTLLPRTFKLCIWVIYQIRRTPIRSWSSSNMGYLGSVCPSVSLSVHTFFALR